VGGEVLETNIDITDNTQVTTSEVPAEEDNREEHIEIDKIE